MAEEWLIRYPSECIDYIDAFRRNLFNYDEVARTLHQFLSEAGGVETVCELGSGTGSNLFRLARFGYRCTGVETNAESIRLSRQRAEEQGLDVDFLDLDFNRALPEGLFDAVLSLFVPIPLRNMESLAVRAAEMIRPGGYFACMLLAQQPRAAGPRKHQDTELSLVDQVPIVRLNFYDKYRDEVGDRIRYDGIYLIPQDPEGTVRMVRDEDTYDLVTGERRLELPPSLYRRVASIGIHGWPAQRPPFTDEIIEIYQRGEFPVASPTTDNERRNDRR